MAETNKRQEVVNHIKLLNQHKQPILDENKNPIVIDQRISLDTESKHFIDFKGSFTNESGKETKSVLTVDKDQAGNFSVGIPNLNLFVSETGESLASVLGAEGNSISLTPLNTPPSKIATFQNGDETCFEILAESGQILLITTNGNSVSIQTKENENAPAKDFIYQVEKGSGLDIDMQPEAVEAFFDPSNEFFHTDIKQITDFPTNILAMYAKLKTGVNEQTRIGKFTMTVISQNENAEPFFFMTRHSQRANAQDNNYLLFENKFYSVEKLLFQKDPADGKLRMVFQIQPRTGNKKSETNKRAVAYDLEVDENGRLTPQSLKVVNYMRSVCAYAEPTTHNEGDIEVETDDGKIVFEQKDRRDYSNYQYYVASNNSNRTVYTEDPQDGKDGKSAYEIAVEHGFSGTEEEWLESLKGQDGKSAYEIAKEHGFQGSEEEWLESLKGTPGLPGINGQDGKDGKDGKSAYEIAVEHGFSGSPAEWLDSLKGEKGESLYDIAKRNGFTGSEKDFIESLRGAEGKSAYEIAQELGFKGSKQEWLDSLKGQAGKDGENGKSAYDVAKEHGFEGSEEDWLRSLKGAPGKNGKNGKNAYELAVENGFKGSPAEWLDSLRGEQGQQGEKGESLYDIAKRNGFTGSEADFIASLRGKSAYDIARENGFEGSEEEWLKSLQGQNGKDGKDSENGNGRNGRDGEDNSLNPPQNDIEDLEQEQPEEKKEKPAPKPAEAPPAEKNFTKLADAFGTAFAYLGVFIAIGAILIPGFAALAIVGCIVSLAGVTTSTLSDKFKFTPFKAAEKKIKELEDQEKEDKEFEEDFLSNEKDLDKAADLTDAKAKELNDYLREFYTDPNDELSQFTGIFEEYGIGFSDIKDAERAKPAEERNNYARTEAMVGRDGLEIRRQMATDLRNIQASQDAAVRAQMIDQFIDTNFRPMPQPVRTALLDNLFGGGAEGNERLTAFVTKLEETVSYGDQERKILDIQHKAIDNAKDSSVNRLINSSKINAEQRAHIVKRYSHQLVRRYANDQNMNEEKLNKTLEKLPEEEQQVIIDTLINAQEQIEQETAHIEEVAHDNRELVANANEAGRYIKAVYAIENGPVSTYNEATSAVIDMLKERTALAHKTSISIASIRKATKNAQTDLDVNSSAYKIVEHTTEMVGSFSNMANSKEVSTSYQNMMNILFTEFPEVASSYLGNDIPAPTGNKQHNIDQMIENIAACPGEKADRLKTALEAYRNARKTAGSVMRTHLSKPVESILAQVFTKEIRDTLQTDEARAAFNARITKKVTELNKESFFRNHIYNDKNAQLHTRLATAIMLIEDKLSDKNLPKNEKDALNRTLKSLSSVVNGTLAEVALESCVITAIDGKSGVKHDEKTLEEKTNIANGKIKGYKRALDIITNMKLPTEKDENGKTATQRIIESFKAITSVKDASATTQLLNILNETVVGGEKLGSKAIEENEPSFKEIYEASRMTSDMISKKVDKLGNLSQAEKDSVKTKIQTAYEVITADPKSSRKDIETAIKAAFGNSGLDDKTLKKIKKDIEDIAKYGAQPIDIQQAEKQIRDKIQSLNKRANKEVHCHDERVGQAQAEREYAHHRAKLSRKDKDFAYETVYDMIFALADKEKFKEEYNKSCEESEKITNEEELLAKLQEDIDKQSKKLSPKKLAARYGISKETYAKKENKLQIYENVYELLEAIAPDKTAEEVEEIIRTEFLNNPKITPAKLAKTLNIPKAFFKDSLAQLSSRGVTEEGQKQLWLKKKEMDEFNDVADEFTAAWKKLVEAETAEDLDNSSILAIEAFVENAKNESYRRAERAKEHKENLKGATGAERSRRKKENQADEKANKKKGKERKAIDERATHYADVLARIGLSIEALDKIVKEAKSSDPATREIAVKQLAEINATLQPEKKIEGAKLDIQNDYETIAVLNNTQFSNQDKALVSAMQQLDEFVKASEDLTKKLDFLASLQGKYNMPPEMVEKAYAAFAAGDQSFFEQTKVGENGDRLALLIEGAEFSTEDLALLRQLGIKPEELTDSKKRDKKLKDIRKNLELQQQQKQAEVDKAKKVANDNKADKTSDMSKQSRKKNREGWNFFKKLFGKKKQQVDAKVNEKKAEQARVDEAKKQAEDERNREKPAEKNRDKSEPSNEAPEAGA